MCASACEHVQAHEGDAHTQMKTALLTRAAVGIRLAGGSTVRNAADVHLGVCVCVCVCVCVYVCACVCVCV